MSTYCRLRNRFFQLLPVLLLAVNIILLAELPAYGHDVPGSNLFEKVIERCKPAVVFIQVTKTNSEQNPYKDDPELSEFFGTNKQKNFSFFTNKTSLSYGSGFLFNSAGFILTNSHVVSNAETISVTLGDKREFDAQLIGTDSKTDIGLLKIEADDLPEIPLGNSDRIRPGQWVLAIGSPYKFIQSVTAGIISATGRTELGIADYENFIQTDAAINPGNSGGPLLDVNGAAIGINTAFQTLTGGYNGIGFAIPINMARYVSEELINKGNITRAWLGVALVDANSKQLVEQGLAPTTSAAYIKEVKPASPAQKAGLLRSDLILKIDGIAISGAADVRNRISLTSPDATVTLTIQRSRASSEVTVPLTDVPQ